MSIPKIQQPQPIQESPQGQGLYRTPDGQVESKEKAFNIFTQQVKIKTQKRNDEVNAHEDMHQSVAGGFGGGKVIESGSDELGNSIATGGHVMIQMPQTGLTGQSSLTQIEKTEEHARIVAASAIAPEALGGDAGKLSAADKSVYAQANAVLGSTTAAKYQRMAFDAKIAMQQPEAKCTCGKCAKCTATKVDKNQEITPDMINEADNNQHNEERKPINIFA